MRFFQHVTDSVFAVILLRLYRISSFLGQILPLFVASMDQDGFYMDDQQASNEGTQSLPV
jgi:hypothetical protein